MNNFTNSSIETLYKAFGTAKDAMSSMLSKTPDSKNITVSDWNDAINALSGNLEDVKRLYMFLTTLDNLISHIGEADLLDGAVTFEKIADGAVGAGKIANYVVTSEKLTNSSVTTEKLNDNSVTTEKLNDSSVTLDKLSDSVNELLERLVKDGVYDSSTHSIKLTLDNDESINISLSDIAVSISELRSLISALEQRIEGKSSATVVEDYSELGEESKNTGYKIGQVFLVKDFNVPDAWVSEVHSEYVEPPFAAGIKSDLLTNTGCRMGYYTFNRLETAKVDLTDYLKYPTTANYGIDITDDEIAIFAPQSSEDHTVSNVYSKTQPGKNILKAISSAGFPEILLQHEGTDYYVQLIAKSDLQRLAFVDPEGKKCIELLKDAKNRVSLTFRDPTGKSLGTAYRPGNILHGSHVLTLPEKTGTLATVEDIETYITSALGGDY